jgi:hypothetical protein
MMHVTNFLIYVVMYMVTVAELNGHSFHGLIISIQLVNESKGVP